MTLVDTSVWIQHLRCRKPELGLLLVGGHVLMHPMIVGELACGKLLGRDKLLRYWQDLPMLPKRPHRDVLEVIESKQLMGSGIGFIDAHLLCVVLYRERTSLWTRDKSLHRTAKNLGVAFSEDIQANG